MIIAIIRSAVHARVQNLIILNDEGFYELIVDMDLEAAKASGDPPGFFKKTMAEHLAMCVQSTGLPLKENLWDIYFSDFAQKEFNMPAGVTA